MSKKRVLVFYDHFYPAFKAGGPVQSIVNLVRNLHEEYEFGIVCKPHELNDHTTLSGIPINQWVNWEEMAQVYYWSYSWSNRAELKQIIKEFHPDIVFINGIYSPFFNVLPLIYSLQLKLKVVLSARGMLHEGALAQKGFKKKLFFSVFRFFKTEQKLTWHATDQKEAHIIQSYFGSECKIAVAGNYPNKVVAADPPTKQEGSLILGTIALISPMKNHAAVIEVLKSATGKITWHVFGPVKDEAYWTKCRAQIKSLPQNISVVEHGEVNPMQIPEALSAIQVFILPSESENFGHAIVEALSAGRPVITTDTTPFKQLQEAGAGYTIRYNQLQEDMAAAVSFFTAMPAETYQQYQQQAKRYINNKLSTEELRQQYTNLFS